MSFLSSYASSLPAFSLSPLRLIHRPVIVPENKLIILFFTLKSPLPPEQSPSPSAGKQGLFSISQGGWSSFIMCLLPSDSMVPIPLTKLFQASVFLPHTVPDVTNDLLHSFYLLDVCLFIFQDSASGAQRLLPQQDLFWLLQTTRAPPPLWSNSIFSPLS